MTTLTISSLNTYGYPAYYRKLLLIDRYFAIADYFNTGKTDILHLQEVFTYYHLFLFTTSLTSFPYYYFEKSVLGPKGGLVTFSRIPLVKTAYYRAPSLHTPLNRSVVEEVLGQKGMLITKIPDKDIALVNIHFKSVLNNDWNRGGKYYNMMLSQVTWFKNILRTIKFKTVLATGDFNLDKKSSLYNELVDMTSLNDINRNIKKNTCFTKFDRSSYLAYCLDYILIYGNSTKYTVLDKQYILEDKVKLGDKWGFVSDHIGLTVTLAVKL